MARALKGIENLIRLQKWNVDEKRREVAELEALLDDLKARAKALEAEIVREQQAASRNAGDTDEVSMGYGAYAKAVIQRRETLQESIAEAAKVVDQAHDELTEMFQELKRYEVARDRANAEREYKEQRQEQADLDEVSIQRHRRTGGGV